MQMPRPQSSPNSGAKKGRPAGAPAGINPRRMSFWEIDDLSTNPIVALNSRLPEDRLDQEEVLSHFSLRQSFEL